MLFEHLNKINEYLTKNISFVFLTRLKDGFQEFIIHEKPQTISMSLYKKSLDALQSGNSYIVTIENDEWFIKTYNPSISLIIVGAVHIAEPLVKLAKVVGFNAILIDPRTNLNINQKFPNIKIYNDWPDVALNKISINYSSALVTLTHDPKLDDVALKYILNTKVFYIGCLGSKKTHSARLSRLKKAGFDDNQLKRIHGPIGLKIKARSPSEIALSIISEIILESKNEI